MSRDFLNAGCLLNEGLGVFSPVGGREEGPSLLYGRVWVGGGRES